MKRINLTENDIFNIVNRVIAEQTPNTKTPEELIKRFLTGDSTGPGLKNKTFKLQDKRGLNKDLMSFIVKNVELVDTQSKGTTARVKGIIYGQSQPETEETVFELICGSFGDFKLLKYKGLDNIKVEPPKPPKEPKPLKEPKPVEKEKSLGSYLPDELVKQKELNTPKNYDRFEYIRRPYQSNGKDIEENYGTGVLIYINEDESWKNNIRDENIGFTNQKPGGPKWFNFYDKSGKVQNLIDETYSDSGGEFGYSSLSYLLATEKNSSEGVKELVNLIKPQFVNDLNFYGVKERKRFNLDEISDKSRNVKVYKTQGKDNKNYNIILLSFK